MSDNFTALLNYIVSFVGVLVGLSVDELLSIFGIVSIIATYATNLYFTRRRDIRDLKRFELEEFRRDEKSLLKRQRENDNEHNKKRNNKRQS